MDVKMTAPPLGLVSCRLAAIVIFALCSCASATDLETVLWPSDKTVLRAQQDSSIGLLPDGSMGVRTGVKYRWPGVRMDFVAGECDLSPYGNVNVAVSNATDRAMSVNLSVKGGAVQGQTPGGKVMLLPHATGEISVRLRNVQRKRKKRQRKSICLMGKRVGRNAETLKSVSKKKQINMLMNLKKNLIMN